MNSVQNSHIRKIRKITSEKSIPIFLMHVRRHPLQERDPVPEGRTDQNSLEQD